MMQRPRIVCLTPIKNEEWILEKFLACASAWADDIIIADQRSTDASRAIASRFPKVTMLDNDRTSYNEGYHHGLLLDAARKIPLPRLLIAIDADEFLTPNFTSSGEWADMLKAKPGTAVTFWWANIRPDMKQYWSPGERKPFGFMDDGSPFGGGVMHSGRVPIPSGAPSFDLEEVKVMHYQYTDWKRMESKHRWYQCMERIMSPDKSPVNLYRQYHHMYAVDRRLLRDIPDWWYSGYAALGVDIKKIVKDRKYWWDREVLRLFEERGTKKFAKDAIWNVDWPSVAAEHSVNNSVDARDPRSMFEKFFHRYLSLTQSFSQSSPVVTMDKVFRRLLK